MTQKEYSMAAETSVHCSYIHQSCTYDSMPKFRGLSGAMTSPWKQLQSGSKLRYQKWSLWKKSSLSLESTLICARGGGGGGCTHIYIYIYMHVYIYVYLEIDIEKRYHLINVLFPSNLSAKGSTRSSKSAKPHSSACYWLALQTSAAESWILPV